MRVTLAGARRRLGTPTLRRFGLLALIGFVGLGIPVRKESRTPAHAAAVSPARQPADWKARYARLPLSFELNRGQTDQQVKFMARGQGYTLFLTGEGAVLSLRSQESEVRSQKPKGRMSVARGGEQETTGSRRGTGEVVRVKVVGANRAAQVGGQEELPGKSNYFIGKDPRGWRTDVPNYAQVRYGDVYPGIDVTYYGHGGQLENDFVVAPGADPQAIRLAVEAGNSKSGKRSSKIVVDRSGDLVVSLGGGEVRFHKPVAYQMELTGERSSKSELVDTRFVLLAGNQIGFEVGKYDKRRPLIIDPVLSYATYLGGTGGDVAYAVAVDSSGNAYITGETNSANFPVLSSYRSAYSGNGDAFVSKIDPTGTKLLYSTYLGGSNADTGTAIAVSSSGDAFVTGSTTSADFPVFPLATSTSTTTAFQTAYGGNGDAFVTQLNSTGNGLAYSSYLGGSGADFGQGIAVDSSGDAYVTGSTQSVDFPTLDPIQSTNAGASDVFVTKVNFSGTALVYSTYLGGTQADVGQSIGIDSSGNAFITGYTFSTNFPTRNPLQASNAGAPDAFVAEVNAAGSALSFSTYLGGSGNDRGFGLALDSSGNIYVTGVTFSTDFPTTSGAFQVANHGQGDVFVTKVNTAGSTLVYSTFLGGSGQDQGNGIAVDSSGDAFVTGFTNSSSDFPTSNAIQVSLGISGGGTCGAAPCTDAFVAEVNPSGNGLTYSTFLGGSGADFGQGIALDSTGNAYITGSTSSTNFPAVAGAYQGNLVGSAGNAFVGRIDSTNAPGIAIVPQKVNFGGQPFGIRSPAQTIEIVNEGTQPLTITEITSSSADFTETDNCVGTIPAAGSYCTISVTFTPSSTSAETDQLSITDNATGSPHTITMTGTGITAATAVTVSPTSLTYGNQTVGTVSSAQSVTITNTGTATLDITSIATQGDFNQTNTCGATFNVLNVEQSCTVSVTFEPTATGGRSGSLSVSDNATGSPQTIALSGTGLAVFSLTSPNPVSAVLIGTATTSIDVSASLASGQSSFSGTITPSCSATSGVTCTFSPTSIFIGGTTTMTVSGLTASTPNPFNFTVNGSSGSQTATLAMTLLLEDYTLTVTPPLDQIVSGGTANYTLILTPSNGFNQQVNLACTNVPTGASCRFSSTYVTPNGPPVSIKMVIPTTVSTSSVGPRPWPLGGAPPPLGLWPVGLGTLLSLLYLWRRSRLQSGPVLGLPPAAARFLILSGVLLFALFLASCRSGTFAPAGTRSGNYTITVNGTLNSNTAVVRYFNFNLSVTPIPTT